MVTNGKFINIEYLNKLSAHIESIRDLYMSNELGTLEVY
jgi:hypothetical protein